MIDVCCAKHFQSGAIEHLESLLGDLRWKAKLGSCIMGKLATMLLLRCGTRRKAFPVHSGYRFKPGMGRGSRLGLQKCM
jgi:hypothetical protein